MTEKLLQDWVEMMLLDLTSEQRKAFIAVLGFLATRKSDFIGTSRPEHYVEQYNMIFEEQADDLS